MNARQVGNRACSHLREHVWCEHWKANIVLVVVSFTSMALALRQVVWFALFAFPTDSHAFTIAAQAVQMTWWHFAAACGIAAWGGVAKLLHELRESREAFSFTHATGHMFISQFAGVLTYLIALYMAVPWPLGIVACGVAGWGGTRAISRIDAWTSKRVFGDDEK